MCVAASMVWGTNLLEQGHKFDHSFESDINIGHKV